MWVGGWVRGCCIGRRERVCGIVDAMWMCYVDERIRERGAVWIRCVDEWMSYG